MGKLQCVFRRPRFPIVCNVDGQLVAGETLQQFARRIDRVELPAGRTFAIVDARGEGWVLHPELDAISPFTLDRRWTKARVIEMFNTSLNAQRSGLRYLQRSLANRRLDAVIRDVVDLIVRAERAVPSGTAKGGRAPEIAIASRPLRRGAIA